MSGSTHGRPSDEGEEILAILARLDAAGFTFEDYDAARGLVILKSFDGSTLINGESMNAALEAAEAWTAAEMRRRGREV